MTGSRRTANKDVPLQALGIHLKHYCLEELDQYSDSEMVQQLLRLVWYSKNIRPRTFGRELQGKTNQGDNENKNERAAKLAIDCRETKTCDGSEADWEHLLYPQVFRSFIQSDDNKGYTESPIPAYHCLACRRDFLPGSQPQVNSIRNTRNPRGETNRSEIEFCLGSDWRVYACSETEDVHGDGFRYPLVQLWMGNSKDEESVLQLLSIVELIRFWVDYTYKPVIGSCISRLEAIKACTQPTPLDSTLWKLQIPIDKEQTPWSFSQRRLKVSRSPVGSKRTLGIPPHGRRRSHSPSGRHSLRSENRTSPRREHRSPTPASEQFAMPERDDFNWLLNRDPGEEDLILIRISETGNRLRPVIIHSTSRVVGERQMPTADWESDSFNAVVEDERQGLPPGIDSILKVDDDGNGYLWQYYRSKERWIHRGVQFSIILPVNVISYGQQIQEFQGAQLFEPLESLFRLHGLLSKIERAKRKWCSCEHQRNKHWRSMVRCRNALCDISWFHKNCVNFSRSDNEAFWLCDECRKTPEDIAYIELMPNESNDFAHASHYRLHLARAIESVWYEHDWPSQDWIIAKIDEIADKVDIIESAPYTIREAGFRWNPGLPRCWATSKDNPKELILACSRNERLLYLEAVSNEEGKNEDTKDVEDFEEETAGYTDEDDEDESNRPKTTEARGRSKSVDANQTIYVETDTATGSEDDTLVSAEGFQTPNKTKAVIRAKKPPLN